VFIVELILHRPRRIDCVAETACCIGYSVDVEKYDAVSGIAFRQECE
jgi:hypothetical protein